MGSGDDSSVEVTNPILGSLKASGPNITLIFTLGTFVFVVIIAYILNAHAGDAKDTGKAVAQELKESNKEVAQALRESNKEVAKVLNELAQAMREANCLAQFTKPEEKKQNSDLCKRLSR